MATLIAKEYEQFEDIKHTDEKGVEFWYARELSLVLDYTKWENFSKVIDKAMLSCQNSGFECADHFLEARKMVQLGMAVNEKLKIMSFLVMLLLNCTKWRPRKNQLLLGQTYLQSKRRQEIADAFKLMKITNSFIPG